MKEKYENVVIEIVGFEAFVATDIITESLGTGGNSD